jgi:phage portal protein BeeE
MRKREGPSHQPWVDDAALFVHEVEAAIGPRPKGMYLRLKSEAEGYVPGNVQWGERPRNKNQHVALNDQQRSEVIELVDSGETQTSVAKAYGVSRSLIGDIYKKHRAAQ